MKILLIGLTLLTSASSFAIYKGSNQEISPNNFSQLVKIDSPYSLCSGYRISYNFVLTAGHCLNNTKRVNVSYLDGDKIRTEKINIKKIKLKGLKFSEEVALIPIKPKLQNKSDFQPLRVSNTNIESYEKGDRFLIAGFGFDDALGSIEVGQLKSGYVSFEELYLSKYDYGNHNAQYPMISLRSTMNTGAFLGWVFDEKMDNYVRSYDPLRHFEVTPGQKSCQGDSGGAVFIVNENGQILEYVGILSYFLSKKKCAETVFAVPIFLHLDFLEDNNVELNY